MQISKLIAVSVLLAAILGAFIWVIWRFFSPIVNKRYWVKKAAKELGVSKETVMATFNTFLNQAKKFCQLCHVDMRFTHYDIFCKRKALSMGTAVKLNVIYYSPIWIYLVATNPHTWGIAFLHSVGHEFNHRYDAKKGKGFIFRSKEERRFFNWLQEVRNDFWGFYCVHHFYPSYSRKTILNAIEKKAEFYDKAKKKGKYETTSHPSWKLRVALLKKYNTYCEEVIEEIAKAAGCTNQEYINALHCTLLPF